MVVESPLPYESNVERDQPVAESLYEAAHKIYRLAEKSDNSNASEVGATNKVSSIVGPINLDRFATPQGLIAMTKETNKDSQNFTLSLFDKEYILTMRREPDIQNDEEVFTFSLQKREIGADGKFRPASELNEDEIKELAKLFGFMQSSVPKQRGPAD